MGLFDRSKKSVPPVGQNEEMCPKCRHVFVPPDKHLVTRAGADGTALHVLKCPQCGHLWGRRK